MPEKTSWHKPAIGAWIGFDPRECGSFAVARQAFVKSNIRARGIVLDRMRERGLYWRPTEIRKNPDTGVKQLWDCISEYWMSTEFAISRFLTPILQKSGVALFMDCDQMFRETAYIHSLFHYIEMNFSEKAIVCVKHNHNPENQVKMDGQAQSRYNRKNWSSFMFFNVDHEANKALTLDLVNSVPGRDLHRFCWLGDDSDDLIGELPPEWNFLVGHTDSSVDPKHVHWTDGPPLMEGYENVPFADEFRKALYDWAE